MQDNMFDVIEKIGHSLIQHGPVNQRVYVMKVADQDLPGLAFKVDVLAQRHGYTKLFVKVPRQVKPLFAELGYSEEAAIPGFYDGEVDAVFLAKYLDPQRQDDPARDEIAATLAMAKEKAQTACDPAPADNIDMRLATPDDAETLADVYRQVFESYPFPIHDPAYLRETMRTHVQYVCAVENGRIIAVSSSEMDRQARNVEMTDFATLPECRGKSIAQRLLAVMEANMTAAGMQTFYTIARALSPGMNITFARADYTFGGTLTNNTNICGKIESMNVWYKPANQA
jgi:putative beta-lysine N-acetyltransferase